MSNSSRSGAPGRAPVLPLWKIEKDAITRTLEACGGDVQKAAVVLEISASTIYRKLRPGRRKGRPDMGRPLACLLKLRHEAVDADCHFAEMQAVTLACRLA